MLDLSIHLHVKVRIITPPLSSRSTWPVSREQGLCALDWGLGNIWKSVCVLCSIMKCWEEQADTVITSTQTLLHTREREQLLCRETFSDKLYCIISNENEREKESLGLVYMNNIWTWMLKLKTQYCPL